MHKPEYPTNLESVDLDEYMPRQEIQTAELQLGSRLLIPTPEHVLYKAHSLSIVGCSEHGTPWAELAHLDADHIRTGHFPAGEGVYMIMGSADDVMKENPNEPVGTARGVLGVPKRIWLMREVEKNRHGTDFGTYVEALLLPRSKVIYYRPTDN